MRLPTQSHHRSLLAATVGVAVVFALAVGPANVIFEAPSQAAQSWFIKSFGASVNLGNIPPDEVIPLETLRLGLRGDTLKEVLLGGEPAPTA